MAHDHHASAPRLLDPDVAALRQVSHPHAVARGPGGVESVSGPLDEHCQGPVAAEGKKWLICGCSCGVCISLVQQILLYFLLCSHRQWKSLCRTVFDVDLLESESNQAILFAFV